jgi:Protein of unknown function (DUF551)
MNKAEQLAEERYPYFKSSAIHISNNDLQDAQREAFIAGYESDKWISRDNPPKEALQNVIALLKNGTVTEMTYSSITNSWFKSGIARESKKNKVTHWQPLPQPPKTN